METAVEWLFENIHIIPKFKLSVQDTIDKAKQMEKEQIIDAFWNGDNSDCTLEQNAKQFAEQYYNKKYNQNK